jgi:hypothetical protein
MYTPEVDTIELVQLDPRHYSALRCFEDGRFGMRLYLNGRRRLIRSVGAFEIERVDKDTDALSRMQLTGPDTLLGEHGEGCNYLIFNTEPVFPNYGSNVMAAVGHLGRRFTAALAEGRVTYDSLLVLREAMETYRDDRDGVERSHVDHYTRVDRSVISFCSCSALELHDGSGLWQFRWFIFEIRMDPL